jgi:uncharacterized protein (DUF302 family)
MRVSNDENGAASLSTAVCLPGSFMPVSDSLGVIEGLTSIQSIFGPKETVDRLVAEISAKEMSVFGRIDHAAGATEVGLTLRPTELIIFGNARAGTPLMQSEQTVGIDLPLRALVWEDAGGKTWLSYNEPSWIARRHGVRKAEQVVTKIGAVLSAIVRKAANPN